MIDCIKLIEIWWETSPRSRGNIAGGLVLLERLRSNFDLDIESHKAEHSDQLKGATLPNVQKILARYGEERILLKEGGRTNRGLIKNLSPLVDAMINAKMANLSDDDKDRELEKMQSFLADKAKEIFNSEKISFDYKKGMTSRAVVSTILESGQKREKAGAVAEYLVGAKLALRFPDYDIRNSAASAADDQANEQGDFQINDSVFHVTISPNRGHYDKCQRNLANDLRVFLLVPDSMLAGARQNAYLEMGSQVSVEAIESFVSQNIEEISDFANERIACNIKSLLEKYNERVAEVETDLALQINIPAALEE